MLILQAFNAGGAKLNLIAPGLFEIRPLMCGFLFRADALCPVPALCVREREKPSFASLVSRRLSKREIIISRGWFLHTHMQIKDNGIYRWENNFSPPSLATNQKRNVFFRLSYF